MLRGGGGLNPELSISFTHTHTHTYILICSHSQIILYTVSITLTLTHSHIVFQTLSLTLVPTLSYSHTHSHSYSHTHYPVEAVVQSCHFPSFLPGPAVTEAQSLSLPSKLTQLHTNQGTGYLAGRAFPSPLEPWAWLSLEVTCQWEGEGGHHLIWQTCLGQSCLG